MIIGGKVLENKCFIYQFESDQITILPPVQVVGLVVSVVPEDLDIVEHAFDGLLSPGELLLDVVAVGLGVTRVEVVNALGLVLDPGLDVVQAGVRVLGLLVDLLGQALELLQAGDLVVDELIALLVQGWL